MRIVGRRKPLEVGPRGPTEDEVRASMEMPTCTHSGLPRACTAIEITPRPTPTWTAGSRKRWPNEPGRSSFDPPRTSGIGRPGLADGYAPFEADIPRLAKHALPHVGARDLSSHVKGEQIKTKGRRLAAFPA